MKHLIYLLAVSTAYAGTWFWQPQVALVIPGDSGISYHGMNGMVNYKNGESFGIAAGRFVGPWKIYASYDYTQFYASQINLQTPIGQVSQSDSDLYHSHTVLLNADYRYRLGNRLSAYIGAGVGGSFDDGDAGVVEIRTGIEKLIGGGTLSLGARYRSFIGQIKEGKKSDGSYSITADRPSQIIGAVTYSFNF